MQISSCPVTYLSIHGRIIHNQSTSFRANGYVTCRKRYPRPPPLHSILSGSLENKLSVNFHAETLFYVISSSKRRKWALPYPRHQAVVDDTSWLRSTSTPTHKANLIIMKVFVKSLPVTQTELMRIWFHAWEAEKAEEDEAKPKQTSSKMSYRRH